MAPPHTVMTLTPWNFQGVADMTLLRKLPIRYPRHKADACQPGCIRLKHFSPGQVGEMLV